MSTDVEAIRTAVDLVDVVGRYLQLTKVGGEFRGLCPFHDDKNPSLTVNQAKQVWACFACGAHEQHGADVFGFVRSYENCTFPEAIAKLQNGSGGNGAHAPERKALQKPPPRKTFPPPAGEMPDMVHQDLGIPVKVWTIRTREGAAYFHEARYMVGEEKHTRFFTWGQHGSEPPRWECRHPNNPRPFYGLEFIDKLGRDGNVPQVMIHEAPKKAEAARALFPGQIHLGMVGGAHQAANMDVSLLKGRRCLLVPDNDVAGREAMQRLALRLQDAGAAEVKVVDTETLPDGSLAPAGWDLADAVGWTSEIALQWARARLQVPVQAAPGAAAVSVPPPTSTPAAAPNAPERDPSPEPPPEGSEAKPPKKTKPRLAAVDGNAVRKPWAKAELEPEVIPALSEFGLKDRFVDQHGQDWRFTPSWQTWFHWEGTQWKANDAWIWHGQQCCKAAMVEYFPDTTPSQRLKVGSLKTVKAMMGLAGGDPRIIVGADAWDEDPMLLGTPAGVIDLRTGELAEVQREQLISKQTKVSPAVGPHPWWDRVLARSNAPLDFLQRWCGYMLTGDTREERFFFIHGPGAGGKSKFLTAIGEILGDYRCNAKSETFMAKSHSDHPEEIARFVGARLVSASEIPDGSRWNEALITMLTGRDKVSARFMHKGTFEYYPQMKLVLVGNHRPALRSVGEEIRRRLDLLEWGGTIPESERVLDLPDKLREEYPAILAWMIEGCLAWQREGLGRPEQIQAATRDYLSAEDSLGAWIDDCVELKPGARTQSSAAYRSFRKWAENAGEYVPSQKRFTGSLRDRGFQTVKASGIYFLGFDLKQDTEYPASYMRD